MGFDGLSDQSHRREAVTETSAAAYRDESEHIAFRERTVLRWLESFSVCAAPTSAELAKAVETFDPVVGLDKTARLLFVRRGLSGLKAIGKVQHGQPRVCAVTHRTCETWVTK